LLQETLVDGVGELSAVAGLLGDVALPARGDELALVKAE